MNKNKNNLVKNKLLTIVNNNDIDEQQAQEIQDIPMGDDTIKKYYPNAKIMKVSALSKYNNIDELLPNNTDYVFLLYQSSSNNGHWVLVSKYDGIIENFSSYGDPIDGPQKWTNIKVRTMLGEGKPYLSMILANSNPKYRIICNGFDFQNENDSSIATCGRWSCLRLNTILKDRIGLNDFIKIIKQLKKETKLTYDELISDIINQK